jgi:ATP-dependent RNA helicase RhlE
LESPQRLANGGRAPTTAITAVAIHGNKSQPQRMRALAAFKNNKVAVLVATEVAARGMDIESLPHVVNFELPMVASDYVHRIGRTGRAGTEGDAISLVCVDEGPLLADIERLLGHRIETEFVEGFTPDRSIRPQPIRFRSSEGRHQNFSQHRGQQPNRPSRGNRPHQGDGRPPQRWNRDRHHSAPGSASGSARPNSLPGERLSRG